jgi:hypothetical protein
MKKILELINNLKIKAFALLPNWFKNLRYAEYILHAILGTALYFTFCLFMAQDYAFATVVIIAFGIELLSEFRKGGSGNFFDAIATFAIPFIIFTIKNIL